MRVALSMMTSTHGLERGWLQPQQIKHGMQNGETRLCLQHMAARPVHNRMTAVAGADDLCNMAAAI